MSRNVAEGLFKDGIGTFDTLNRSLVQSDPNRQMWEGARDILSAFFVLACDYVYGAPGETRPYDPAVAPRGTSPEEAPRNDTP